MCVCVCVLSSYLLCTSDLWRRQPGSTHEQGHTEFSHLPSAVLALIFLARRIQPSLSLVDHEVDFLFFFTHELVVLHLLGIFLLITNYYYFSCESKSQFV